MNNKTLFYTLSLLAGFFSMQSIHAETPLQPQNSHQSITLDMQNMTCAMCKFTIKKALQGVEGVQNVKVDYDTKTANVTFNPQQTNNESLIKATTNAGYPSTVRQEK
ncbi:MAG: cation transporter [Methylococcaceae bacterium]